MQTPARQESEPAPYRLDDFEIATGYVAGADPATPPLPADAHQGMTPLQALEAAVLPALSRPPCLVVFSGGRDSSAILAVATDLARRHGLPDPVPATNRFRSAPETDEREWQELVVRHLGLAAWHIREWDFELDVIGPIAQPVLARWGPVYPHNAHFSLSLLEVARGGSALTGVGGDQIFFAGQSLRLARLFTLQERPHLRDWRAVASTLAPRALYKRVWQRRLETPPWLTPAAADRLRRLLAADIVDAPIWFAPFVRRRMWRKRSRLATQQTLAALSSPLDICIAHPFEDPGFLAAVSAAVPRSGYRTRDEAMRVLFGHLLPASLLERRSKAAFNQAFFNAYSRVFVGHWDGTGLNSELVDADRLRHTWTTESVDARAFSALQQAWTTWYHSVMETGNARD